MLLLWPTLWALWLAAGGWPGWRLLLIFVIGVFVMRALGCVINDFADRKLDAQVARTRNRPLAAGRISVAEATGVGVFFFIVGIFTVAFTAANGATVGYSGVDLGGIVSFRQTVFRRAANGFGLGI